MLRAVLLTLRHALESRSLCLEDTDRMVGSLIIMRHREFSQKQNSFMQERSSHRSKMIAPSRYLLVRYPRLVLSVGALRFPFLGTESDDWPACFLQYHSNLLRLRAPLLVDDG